MKTRTGFSFFSAKIQSARVSERLARFQGGSDYFKALEASPPPPRHSCGPVFSQIQKWHFVDLARARAWERRAVAARTSQRAPAGRPPPVLTQRASALAWPTPALTRTSRTGPPPARRRRPDEGCRSRLVFFPPYNFEAPARATRAPRALAPTKFVLASVLQAASTRISVERRPKSISRI